MDTIFRSFPDAWPAILNDVRACSADFQINLVLNVQGETIVTRNYEDFSIEANFMTPTDLSDYVEALRNSGFFVRVFLDEVEFIRAVLAEDLWSSYHRYNFTYCPAINSTGAGRRAFMPGFCNHFQLPTLNNNPYSATIGRHKHHCAKLLRCLGFPTPETWLYQTDGLWLDNTGPGIGQKVIVKPSYECSSIGVGGSGSTQYSEETKDRLAVLSAGLSQPITVQSFVPGDEFEVVVLELGGEFAATPVAVIDEDGSISGERTLDYQKVRKEDYGYVSVESDHPQVSEMSEIARNAAKALGFVGISRIDMRLDSDGHPLIFDVSSTPDLTRMSSCAQVFKALGMTYDDLWLFAIASSFQRHHADGNC